MDESRVKLHSEQSRISVGDKGSSVINDITVDSSRDTYKSKESNTRVIGLILVVVQIAMAKVVRLEIEFKDSTDQL